MQSSHRIYTFDANIFIHLASFYYPIDVFPSLWEEIWKLIKLWRLQVISFIYDEVQNDDIKKLFKPYEIDFLLSPQDIAKINEVQSTVTEILMYCPEIVDTRKWKNGWDPWLVSFAKHNNLVVVTWENRWHWKVPNVCKDFKVECIDLLSFLRELKIEL